MLRPARSSPRKSARSATASNGWGPTTRSWSRRSTIPTCAGVTCYISRARTGGIKGAFGLAEDPAEASIACRQVGPIDVAKLDKLKSPHEVFSERASLIFKTTQVVRFWDAKRRVLVYLIYTDRIIEGSPQNSISVVPVGLNG